MKALLKKKYIEEYNLKSVTKAVLNLFDDYNYKINISYDYLGKQLNHELYEIPVHSGKSKKQDEISKIVEKRENVLNYINEFDRKLKILKNEFTSEELAIFKYCIIERAMDKEVMDQIAKTEKTYYNIKKSCFVKIALRYNLVDGYSKKVYFTISLVD